MQMTSTQKPHYSFYCFRQLSVSAFFLCSSLASLSHAAPDARQIQLLANNCLQCHVQHGVGAPQLGVADDWIKIKAQGEDAILDNVVYGLRGMPPLGYCSACSEQDFRELIRLMTGLEKPDSNNGAGEKQ